MMRRKINIGINDRIGDLLRTVNAQDVYRRNALNTFIAESLKRIARVSRIKGDENDDELKLIFLAQLDAAVHDRKFLTNVFKLRDRNSRDIDYDNFRTYMHKVIPLLSSDGLISKAEDIETCNKCISERTNKLIHNQNAYVGHALSVYLKDKQKQLSKKFDVIKLEPEVRIDIRNSFVEKLEKFNFSLAYTRIGYENKCQKFKRDKNEPFDIDYQSFHDIVSDSISFHQPDDFISKDLSLSQQKEHFIFAVNSIKTEINKYSGGNKSEIIKAFNTKIEEVKGLFSEDNIKKNGFFSVATGVKNQLDVILKNIQKNENQYYKRFWLFAEARKDNSSLQPKINEARKIFDKIEIGAHRMSFAKS